MIVISHRGYWLQAEEKNSVAAFKRSFNLGMGTETDVRDSGSRVVISHDMPKGGELYLEDLLDIMGARRLPLALNIKADGLTDEIKRIMSAGGFDNYFTFDMSIPDMVYQLRQGMPVYTGLSDILPQPVLFGKAVGIWLDCFEADWYTSSVLDDLVSQGKKVCIVSAELHGRNAARQWSILAEAQSLASDQVMLCTDTPLEAKAFFGI